MQGIIYQTWGLPNWKKSLFFRKPERSVPNLCSSYDSSTLQSVLRVVAPKGPLQMTDSTTVLQEQLSFPSGAGSSRLYSGLAFSLKFLDHWFRWPRCISLAQQQASMTWQARCSMPGEACITQTTEAVVQRPVKVQDNFCPSSCKSPTSVN